jgi:hypothetical protein
LAVPHLKREMKGTPRFLLPAMWRALDGCGQEE